MTKIEVLAFDLSSGFDTTRTPCEILARQEVDVDAGDGSLDERIRTAVVRLGVKLARLGYARTKPVGLFVRGRPT